MDLVQPVPGTGPGSLWVLPAGTTTSNPSDLAASPLMREMLERLRSEFDRVVIDGGALLVGTEAVSVAEDADGVCMVARYQSTHGRDIERALGRLDQVGVTKLGVVIWDAPDELFFVGVQSRSAPFDRSTSDSSNGPRPELPAPASWSA